MGGGRLAAASDASLLRSAAAPATAARKLDIPNPVGTGRRSLPKPCGVPFFIPPSAVTDCTAWGLLSHITAEASTILTDSSSVSGGGNLSPSLNTASGSWLEYLTGTLVATASDWDADGPTEIESTGAGTSAREGNWAAPFSAEGTTEVGDSRSSKRWEAIWSSFCSSVSSARRAACCVCSAVTRLC